MVRALPLNPWEASHLFPRLRPGIAISIVFHAVLLLGLATILPFPPMPAQPDSEKDTIFVIPPPVVRPPPAKPEVRSGFHPKALEPLDRVVTSVRTLIIPVEPDDRRTPPTTTKPVTESPPVIIDPHPVSRGGLVYPDRAAEAGTSGYVDFTFIIEPDGSVGDAQVIDEVPQGYGFATAARKAFPTWKFEPKTMNGVAIAALARIRVSFELR